MSNDFFKLVQTLQRLDEGTDAPDSQLKGKEKVAKSKPSATGEQKNVTKGKLVGEAKDYDWLGEQESEIITQMKNEMNDWRKDQTGYADAIVEGIAIGQNYDISAIKGGRRVVLNVTVTDFVKKPGQKNMVHFQHKGKPGKLSAGAFKNRMITTEDTLTQPIGKPAAMKASGDTTKRKMKPRTRPVKAEPKVGTLFDDAMMEDLKHAVKQMWTGTKEENHEHIGRVVKALMDRGLGRPDAIKAANYFILGEANRLKESHEGRNLVDEVNELDQLFMHDSKYRRVALKWMNTIEDALATEEADTGEEAFIDDIPDHTLADLAALGEYLKQQVDGVAEGASPMVVPPSNRFSNKKEAFAAKRELEATTGQPHKVTLHKSNFPNVGPVEVFKVVPREPVSENWSDILPGGKKRKADREAAAQAAKDADQKRRDDEWNAGMLDLEKQLGKAMDRKSIWVFDDNLFTQNMEGDEYAAFGDAEKAAGLMHDPEIKFTRNQGVLFGSRAAAERYADAMDVPWNYFKEVSKK